MLLLNTINAYGQEDSVQTRRNFFGRMLFPDTNQVLRYRILPVLTYSPETRIGLGAGFILNWDYKDAKPGTNSSLLQSFFIYTQNDQIDWTSLFEIFTNENRFFFSGKIGYLRFPQYFYGVGNELSIEQREKFSFNQFYFDLKNRIRVGKGLYLGLDYYFNKNYDIIWQEGSKYQNDSTLFGTEGYVLSGLGPEIAYDTRDFPFNPTKGSFLSASILVFAGELGSQFNYSIYQVDLRHYISINEKKKWVLAFNLYGLFANGNVPFNRIPALGGEQIMRGYYSGRYRDHNYIAGQLEWRMPIWKFIGFTAWVATGQVGADLKTFSWQGFKPNVGLGLRVRFDKKSRTNIRLDQGFGRDSRGFYLKINEAF